MKKLRPYILAAMAAGFVALPVMADDYYDDLYAPARPATPKKASRVKFGPNDYPSADQYASQVSGSLNMDVDRYNRRNSFLVGEPQKADTVGSGDTFAYTRRIERYHNPEVVTESGDTTLVDYYYSAPQPQNINVYVVDNTPSIYYNWAWRYGNPWYWNVYGPAYIGWGGWSYSPYWDPYWSYGWNPYWNYGWGWGWDPYWDYGWGWGGSHWGHSHWGGWYPGNGYKPTSSGAYRPHGGGSSGLASRNPGQSGNRNDYGNMSRPGNMGRPTYNGNYSSSGTVRPGYTGTASARPGTRPSTSQGTYTPYGSGTRGRSSYSGSGNTNTYRSSSSSSNSGYDSYRSSSSDSRSTYRSSSSGSSSSSRSSYGGGSHSTRGGGSSGGSYSGGGGGSRGRR